MSEVATFWARRRAAVRAEEDAERIVSEAAVAEARAAELSEKDDCDVLTELGLPDPATMKQGDDFSGFLAKEVPEHLRRQALRTLWRSNPVLACVDGLNEYDDDYRAAMLLQGPIKTAYQVGKGMLKHVEEMERKAKAAAEAAEEALPEDEDEVVEQVAEDTPPSEDVAVPEGPHITAADHVAQGPAFEESAPSPAPRRMRFHFDEASA